MGNRKGRRVVQIPAKMRAERRWVTWNPVRRGARITKIPAQPNGAFASSTAPLTWSTWEQVESFDRHGFMLGGGWACLDLDHCLIDGELTDVAREVIDLIGPTWIEVSPSGDGLHVWMRSNESAGRVLKIRGQAVEVYSQGRYITVTGIPWQGSTLDVATVPDPMGLLHTLI